MTTDEFRAALARLELNQAGFARIFTALGDTTTPLSILRRVERWAQGGSQIPGEVVAILTLLERFPAVMEALRPEAASARQQAAAAALNMPIPARAVRARPVTKAPRVTPQAKAKAPRRTAKGRARGPKR